MEWTIRGIVLWKMRAIEQRFKNNISAGLDRIELENEEKGDPLTSRLISIFSRISLSDRPRDEKYYKLSPLGAESFQETFPIEDMKCMHTEYAILLRGLEKEGHLPCQIRSCAVRLCLCRANGR
jgi:hypothetical protein